MMKIMFGGSPPIICTCFAFTPPPSSPHVRPSARRQLSDHHERRRRSSRPIPGVGWESPVQVSFSKSFGIQIIMQVDG